MTHSKADKRPRDGEIRVLIIEDSEFDQKRMQRVIERNFLGVRTVTVSTIRGAREVLEKNRIALILLDNNLPDGKGANFAMELAADEYYSKIPIIIVSDWPSPFMWDKAETAGVLHVVNKSDFGARFIHSAFHKRNKKAM